MQEVRVITGLGNPGPAYDGTRHNIGFDLVHALGEQHGASWTNNVRFRAHTATIVISGYPVLLVKPTTFMNLSGNSVSAVCRYYRWHPRQVLVVYDEYTLPLGRVKLTFKGSAGGHNGIAHLIGLLGETFPRFRVGIGADEKPSVPLTEYVLGRFSEAERAVLAEQRATHLQQMRQVIELGASKAANYLNRKISLTNNNT